jgi:antitoxin MazE
MMIAAMGLLPYDIHPDEYIVGVVMHVAKWGNSLAVRLPKALVDELGIVAGDELKIVHAEGRRLEIEKDDRRQRALASLSAMSVKMPEGYKFDRDEANKR